MSLRLLCVTAHPDDECFAFGGALLLAAQRNVETYVLCLTDGSAGSHRGTASSAKELGKLRREEFAASNAILGVKQSEVLDYHDGQLDQQPLATLAEEIVARIRSFRPQVVLTFGSDGAANTHPDHTTISAATSAAFHWAGHPKRFLHRGDLWQPQRLYLQTTDFFLPDRHKPVTAPWTLTLDISAVLDKKLEAFAKHTTQAPLAAQTRELFLKYGQNEHYLLAAALVPQPARQSTDMLEGIADTHPEAAL